MSFNWKEESVLSARTLPATHEKYTKYDLRTWNPNGKPGKGITLTKEELKKLHKLIGEEIRQMGGHNE